MNTRSWMTFLALGLLLAATPPASAEAPSAAANSKTTKTETEPRPKTVAGVARIETLKKGFRLTPIGKHSAKDLEKTLQKAFPKAKIQLQSKSLRIQGVELAPLTATLTALRQAKPETPSAEDEVDLMLADVRNQGDVDSDSGSSIRATQETTLAPKETQIQGEVVDVRRLRFPVVHIRIKLKSPFGALKVGDELVVIPEIRVKRGRPTDAASKQNLDGWYAYPGDRIQADRVKADAKGRLWVTRYQVLD